MTNLSEDTREQDLIELFHPFGALTRAYVMLPVTRRNISGGFGFVNFVRERRKTETSSMFSLVCLSILRIKDD